MFRKILESIFSKEWIEIYYLCANKTIDVTTCKDCDSFIIAKKGHCFEAMVNKHLQDNLVLTRASGNSIVH